MRRRREARSTSETDSSMEKNPSEHFRLTHQDSDRIVRLDIPPRPPQALYSFNEEFNLRGIRLDRFEPGFVSCCFTVPPRLTGRNGNQAVGAIASLVDEIGATMIYEKNVPMNVSVDVSISYLSTAKLNVTAHGDLLSLSAIHEPPVVSVKAYLSEDIE